jgi:hypothetical protein
MNAICRFSTEFGPRICASNRKKAIKILNRIMYTLVVPIILEVEAFSVNKLRTYLFSIIVKGEFNKRNGG